MPAPRRLTPAQAGKNTRNLTSRAIQRQLRDGIEVDFVKNVFYAKAPGRQAQVVQSIEQLFPYAGTNQGYYRASNGLLVPSVNNVPRIEYDSSNNVQGLLEEFARTNLCLRSADFGTTWVLPNSTVSTNVATDPVGTVTADKLVENTATALHRAYQDVTIVANASYTFSLFAKASERSELRIILSSTDQVQYALANFNLLTGVVASSTAGGTGTLSGATISAYRDGWYRITVSGAIGSGLTTLRAFIDLSNAGTLSYLGDGSSGLFLFGAQIEAGVYATSYMPTDAATVTRGSETFTRIIGNEIVQGQGTFVVEYRTNNSLLSTFATAMSLDDNSTNNRIFMFRNNVGTRTAGSVSGGVSQFSSAGGDNGSTFRKCVMVYSSAGYRHFMNGALVGAVGAALVPTVTRLRLGNSSYGADFLNGHIKRFKYFPYVMTDEEAIAETV